MIPTAEEFLQGKFKKIYQKQPENFKDKIQEGRYLDLHVTGRIDGREQNYPEMMLEFTQLHVQAALESASENARCYVDGNGDWVSSNVSSKIRKESILSAYPLGNIK